jgi:ectoine hydroxylase-related dioxygenase (phytanoyl-CoA dioxygenase family)
LRPRPTPNALVESLAANQQVPSPASELSPRSKPRVEDLSKLHSPVTDLFPALSGAELSRFALASHQIEFFDEFGYLAPVRLLDEHQVEVLRAEVDALSRSDHPGHHLFYEYHSNESTDPARILFHALGGWRISPALHDLLWHPGFTVPAAQLLRGAVRFWHDQLFCKPARDGACVAWHQDYSYWTRTRPMAHLSCFIALDDTTRANGCLEYVPKSHRWELLPITGLAGGLNAIEDLLDNEQKSQFKPVAIELKRGEASFHHPLMVHGSRENTTAWPRRAAVINVFRDGVISASDDPPLEGVPAVPAGSRMDGRFFPLLFDPAT